MQIAFFEGLTNYVNQFKLLLDGTGVDCVNEDIGGSRIRYIFNSTNIHYYSLCRGLQGEDDGIGIC